jgi:hypothetical protein
MTRPLIAVTRDEAIKQYLVHLDGPVLLAGGADDVPALYDEALLEYGELPLVVAGSDVMHRDPIPPPRCFGVVYADIEAIDGDLAAAAMGLGICDRLIYLPCQWDYLLTLLNSVSLETA